MPGAVSGINVRYTVRGAIRGWKAGLFFSIPGSTGLYSSRSNFCIAQIRRILSIPAFNTTVKRIQEIVDHED